MDLLLIQAVASGVMTGCVYAMVALGLTIIFGVMRIVNFAHGDFLMIAMYGAFFSWSLLMVNPMLTAIWMVPLLGLVGAIFYRFIARRLVGKSELTSMTVTMGLSLLLQNIALLVFKADNLFVTTPSASNSIMVGPIPLQQAQVFASLATVGIMGVLFLIIRCTDLGLTMRAVSQSTEGALLSGIDSHRVAFWTCAIGIGALGLAGPFLVPLLYVNPGVGAQFTLTSFVVVIAGGLGSFGGAVLAGLLVGVVERVSSLYLSASLAAAMPFVLLVVVMLWRPQGLLVKGRK